MQLDSENVLTATIHEPIEGRWWIDLAMPAGDELSGLHAFTLGTTSWVGTVTDPTIDGSRRRMRLVGGRNGLRAKVSDKFYRGGVTLGQIATEILASGGELLDPASDLLTRKIETWQRFEGPAIEALTDLVHANKLAWRITRAGMVKLTLLPHLFPGQEHPGTLLEDDGRSILIAVQSPDIEPGVTVNGHQIHRIVWESTAERISGSLHYFSPPDVRRVQDHRSIAEAGIDAQRDDDSLDVIAASRYGLTEVPLFTGLPGVSVRVAPGSQTLVAFAGSPRRPVAFGSRGGSSGLKIGSLVFIVAPSGPLTGAVIGAQFFDADPVSDAAAQALGIPPNILVPLTFTTAEQQ